MKLGIRSTAVALMTAILTTVGAVTGVGGTRADALSVHTTIEEIQVTLTTEETFLAFNDRLLGAGALCFFGVRPEVDKFLTIPLSHDLCTFGLNACARGAIVNHWTSYSVVFTRELVICPHESEAPL
jgi:hypothetical protein